MIDRPSDDLAESHDPDHLRDSPVHEDFEDDHRPAHVTAAVPKESVEKNHRERRSSVFTGGFLIIGLLTAGGFYYWFTTRNIESTDDAYTDGRAVIVAPQVSGIVVSVDVNDNQFVHKGQALIHIDPRQYEIDRDSAQGALDTARHQLAGQKLAAEIARKNFPALLKQAQAQLAAAEALEAQGTSRRPAPAQSSQSGDHPNGGGLRQRGFTSSASPSIAGRSSGDAVGACSATHWRG